MSTLSTRIVKALPDWAWLASHYLPVLTTRGRIALKVDEAESRGARDAYRFVAEHPNFGYATISDDTAALASRIDAKVKAGVIGAEQLHAVRDIAARIEAGPSPVARPARHRYTVRTTSTGAMLRAVGGAA